jgi:hypothetical protein
METRAKRTGGAVAIASVFSLATTSCDPGGFRLLETGKDAVLRSVFVAARNEIYAVGTEGAVLVTDGKTTTDTSTDAGMKIRPPDLYGAAKSGDDLIVAGDKGVILSRTASVAKARWRVENSRSTTRLLTVIRPAPSIAYAGGEGGRVVRRGAAERTWQPIDVRAPANVKITGGWGISDATIVFTTDKGSIIERTDKDWVSSTVMTETSSSPLPLFGVWSATRGADLVTVGLAGTVYRRKAGTTAWEQEKTPVDQDLYGVFGTKSDRIYAVGARGTIIQWDGSAWNTVPSGTAADLYAISGLADGSLIAVVGARGTIVLLESK